MKKRFVKILIFIAVIAFIAAFVVYGFTHQETSHGEKPLIHFGADPVTVSWSDGKEGLLQDVTAEDPEDGDVTASLLVEGLSKFWEPGKCTVTYVAFDSDGNVSRVARDVIFQDYVVPKFTLSGPLIFRQGKSIDVLANVGAEDTFDGDLSRNVKASVENGSDQITQAGDYNVEYRVTNSMGDTARITLPITVIPSSEYSQYNYRIELTEYLVYLPVGAGFDPGTYFSKVLQGENDVVSGPGLPNGFEINSNMNTAAAGIYSVTYVYTDAGGSGITRLLVVVG